MANRLSIKLLEEISNSIQSKFFNEFASLTGEIRDTLQNISNVTTREIKSYDAITGMIVELDKKLETVNNYVVKNINYSMNIASQIKSTKYKDLSIIQEWFVDYFVFTMSRMTNISEDKIRNYYVQRITEYTYENGNHKALKLLDFEQRVTEEMSIIQNVVKHFKVSDCVQATLFSGCHLFMSLIYRQNPIDFPQLETVGNALSEYFRCHLDLGVGMDSSSSSGSGSS